MFFFGEVLGHDGTVDSMDWDWICLFFFRGVIFLKDLGCHGVFSSP